MKTLREFVAELAVKAEIQNPEEPRFYVGEGKKRMPFFDAVVTAKKVTREGVRGASIHEVGLPSYISIIERTPCGDWLY